MSDLEKALGTHDNHEPIDPDTLDILVNAARRLANLTEIQFCTRHGAEKYPESHHRCWLAEKAESPPGECKFSKGFVEEGKT